MRVSSILEFAKRLVKPFTRPFEFLSVVFRYTVHCATLLRYGNKKRDQGELHEFGVVPRLPMPFYTLWGVAQILGLSLVPKKRAHTFLLIDLTFVSPERMLHGEESYINGACNDIGKTHVATLFQEVFGRALAVDPTTYIGPMVEKSEKNGVHNGEIVRGPLSTSKAGHVYQRLVDNTTPDGTQVLDLRAVIVGKTLPLVYKKYRVVKRRFESSSIVSELAEPDDVFSREEQDQLKNFARVLGMDFGELDVLRDRADGQLYIVDANKTCISPPIRMDYQTRFRALQITAEAFEKEFLTL